MTNFKIVLRVQKLRRFCRNGAVCLLVEYYWWRSATNRNTCLALWSLLINRPGVAGFCSIMIAKQFFLNLNICFLFKVLFCLETCVNCVANCVRQMFTPLRSPTLNLYLGARTFQRFYRRSIHTPQLSIEAGQNTSRFILSWPSDFG